jgi:hypothetical protein
MLNGTGMRFFLHVRDGHHITKDDEGSDLVDISAARKEARAAARDLVADRMRGGPPVGDKNILIADRRIRYSKKCLFCR